MTLSVGDKAPAFSAKDQSGETVSLSSLSGKYVVLYFYPKDHTSGCTVEACDFRDQHASLKKAGAVVVGVSPDSEKSHQSFIAKHDLPFQLLVDDDKAVAKSYGAWAKKSLYGRTFMGIVRSTFLIAPDGTLAQVWPKVKVAKHVDNVLEALKAHASGETPAPAKAAKKSKKK